MTGEGLDPLLDAVAQALRGKVARMSVTLKALKTRQLPAVDDALFARLREAFGPEAIVELTAGIALQNLSARFNAALGAEAEGFCELPPPRRDP